MSETIRGRLRRRFAERIRMRQFEAVEWRVEGLGGIVGPLGMLRRLAKPGRPC